MEGRGMRTAVGHGGAAAHEEPLGGETSEARRGRVYAGKGVTESERAQGEQRGDAERVACAEPRGRRGRTQQRRTRAEESTHGGHVGGGGRKSGNSAARESAASGGAQGGRYKGTNKKNVTAGKKEERYMGGARWPTLGIQKTSRCEPKAFTAWLDRKEKPDPKTQEARATIKRTLAKWEIGRVLTKGKEAVICMARADWRVREWSKGGKNGKRPPKLSLMRQVTYETVLPTAVSSGGDMYYLTSAERHMSAGEMCNAFGVGRVSTLRAALTQGREGMGVTEREVVRMMGGAVHVPVLAEVIAGGMKRAGVQMDGRRKNTLYDVCSGVGTAAEAMEQLTGGRFKYVAAAEKGAAQRKILRAAWAHRGLRKIYEEAYSEEAATGPKGEVDIYMMTPTCSKWSSSQGGKGKLAEAMEETKVVQRLMRYATRARPAVVVLESVSDLLGPVRMRSCGEEIERILRASLPDYEWRAQVVDAHEHGGVPMARARAFWVGTRPHEKAK